MSAQLLYQSPSPFRPLIVPYIYNTPLLRPQFSTYATIKDSLRFKGVGLHTGQPVTMTIFPANSQQKMQGIVFMRGHVRIPAHWQYVYDTTLSTNIKNGSTCVRTVEHILSALFMAGISDALIHLDASEVPIMDGSSAPFLEKMVQAPLEAKRPFIKVLKTIRVEHPTDPTIWAQISPYDGFRLSISIHFPSIAPIEYQSLDVDIYNDDLPQEVASARTFVLENDVAMLKQNGLAQGGSLTNAIVINCDNVINPDGLRSADECVRHKALDCIGDLSLASAPLLGHFSASKPGHRLNMQLLQALFAASDNITYTYHA